MTDKIFFPTTKNEHGAFHDSILQPQRYNSVFHQIHQAWLIYSLSRLFSEDMFELLPVSGAQGHIIFIRNEIKLLDDIVNMRLGTPK